jgi:hypothetical protein
MSDEIELGSYIPGGWLRNGEPKALWFSDETAEALRRPDSKPPFKVPVTEFRGHAIVVGQSGAGKTQTILRLISEVTRTSDWQVVVVDAKADKGLANEVRAIAKKFGKTCGVFPDQAYDIFQGEPVDVATRVLELANAPAEDRPMAHAILTKAVAGGAAKAETSQLLLNNLSGLAVPPGRHEQLKVRLWEELTAFFGGEVGHLLSGETNIATHDLFYFGIDALRFPFTASGLAGTILRDIADYVVRRPSRKATRTLLLVFDEFSATPVEVATDLVERIRSFNVQVVLGVQSFAGLGPHGDRLLSASNWVLFASDCEARTLHRGSGLLPESFAKATD